MNCRAILILILFLICTERMMAQVKRADSLVVPPVTRTIPAVRGFYSKVLYCYGIPIRAHRVVDDKALTVAYQKLYVMLANLPVVRDAMAKHGAELHIIGKDQQTSDLPEYRVYKGKKYVDNGRLVDVDERTRGMGGLIASCGEENLLSLPGDRYYGDGGICVHEFAHNIMNNGFKTAAKHRIFRAYLNAMRKGLWYGTYAATNEMEYWAELSSWYFGSHGEFLRDSRLPRPGPEGLRAYDPEGYALLNSIYDGGKPPAARPQPLVTAKLVQKGTVSAVSAKAAGISIVNNTNAAVFLYWIDTKGKPQPYGSVAAKAHTTQLTYMNHVWLLTDLAEKSLGYYSVNAPDCVVVLEAGKPPVM